MAIGFMIGSSFMFSMQCLSLAVLSGGNAADPLGEKPSSEKAVLAFAVFLFLLYVRARARRVPGTHRRLRVVAERAQAASVGAVRVCSVRSPLLPPCHRCSWPSPSCWRCGATTSLPVSRA